MQYSYLKITCYHPINCQILVCYLGTMSKNGLWIIECPGKETGLYFKLKAKQIEAELLTRVISVLPVDACQWGVHAINSLSVYFGYISISLVEIDSCVWNIDMTMHWKVCFILCPVAVLSRLLRLVPWATERGSLLLSQRDPMKRLRLSLVVCPQLW